MSQLQKEIAFQRSEIERIRGWGEMMDVSPGDSYLAGLHKQMEALGAPV